MHLVYSKPLQNNEQQIHCTLFWLYLVLLAGMVAAILRAHWLKSRRKCCVNHRGDKIKTKPQLRYIAHMCTGLVCHLVDIRRIYCWEAQGVSCYISLSCETEFFLLKQLIVSTTGQAFSNVDLLKDLMLQIMLTIKIKRKCTNNSHGIIIVSLGV